MNYFEDIRVGDRVVIGRHTFTADDIKTFAKRFDPQAFHIDEEAGVQSQFGALCASGWHTSIVFMRLMIETQRRRAEDEQMRDEPIAHWGPALGLRDLKWLKPVYAGDTLEYVIEIVEVRASGSRPRFGLATILTTGTNQKGEVAISFFSTTFVERRPVSVSG